MLSYSILKNLTRKTRALVRYKHAPDHWSVVRKKVHPVDKALEHFDDFYKQVFDLKWPSIRKGLLSKQKYVAVINNYGDSDDTMSQLELSGALNIRRLCELEKEYLKNEKIEKTKEIFMKEVEEIDTTLTEKEQKFHASKFSLKNSLNEAKIDSSRLIDPNVSLSSEVLYEFVPATKIKGKEDYIPESTHYNFYNSDGAIKIKIEHQYDFHFPQYLNVYCYEMDNHTTFNPSKKASTGVLNYYLMDGGSVLPILALDLQPGHTFLDMCAAPGGKSLLALQTLYPDVVVSNDNSHSRVQRIKNVYNQFLYDFNEKWLNSGKIRLTNCDGRFIVEDNFDRILVDVPCTTDRHSLHENDNNFFKSSRIKERLKLPELQCELLVQALKLVRIGGVVVYSTCSLSPIQNDGVVHMALKRIWEETKIKVVIKDLSPALRQMRNVYRFADQSLLKYGHLVVPHKEQNFGPTYFCKLKRIKMAKINRNYDNKFYILPNATKCN